MGVLGAKFFAARSVSLTSVAGMPAREHARCVECYAARVWAVVGVAFVDIVASSMHDCLVILLGYAHCSNVPAPAN
jgi:hypothetical protein